MSFRPVDSRDWEELGFGRRSGAAGGGGSGARHAGVRGASNFRGHHDDDDDLGGDGSRMRGGPSGSGAGSHWTEALAEQWGDDFADDREAYNFGSRRRGGGGGATARGGRGRGRGKARMGRRATQRAQNPDLVPPGPMTMMAPRAVTAEGAPLTFRNFFNTDNDDDHRSSYVTPRMPSLPPADDGEEEEMDYEQGRLGASGPDATAGVVDPVEEEEDVDAEEYERRMLAEMEGQRQVQAAPRAVIVDEVDDEDEDSVMDPDFDGDAASESVRSESVRSPSPTPSVTSQWSNLSGVSRHSRARATRSAPVRQPLPVLRPRDYATPPPSAETPRTQVAEEQRQQAPPPPARGRGRGSRSVARALGRGRGGTMQYAPMTYEQVVNGGMVAAEVAEAMAHMDEAAEDNGGGGGAERLQPRRIGFDPFEEKANKAFGPLPDDADSNCFFCKYAPHKENGLPPAYKNAYLHYFSLCNNNNEVEITREFVDYFRREVMTPFNNTKLDEIASAPSQAQKDAIRAKMIPEPNPRVFIHHNRRHPLDLAIRTLIRLRQFEELNQALVKEIHYRQEGDPQGRERVDLDAVKAWVLVTEKERAFVSSKSAQALLTTPMTQDAVRSVFGDAPGTRAMVPRQTLSNTGGRATAQRPSVFSSGYDSD